MWRLSRRTNLAQVSGGSADFLIELVWPFASMHTARVLLVDDERAIQSALRRLLRQDGYEILTADSAEQALTVMQSERIDLVLSDYQMPGMTGIDLLFEVLKRHPQAVRLMLSGQADLAHVIEGMNQGAVSRFLTKPWSNDIVRSTVREAIRRAREEMAAAQGMLGLPGRSTLDPAVEQALHRTGSSCLVLAEIVNITRTLALMPEQELAALGAQLSTRIHGQMPLLSPVCSTDRAMVGFVVESEDIEKTLPSLVLELRKPFETGNTRTGLQFRFGAAPITQDVPTAHRHAMLALGSLSADDAVSHRIFEPQLTANFHLRYTLEQDLHLALDRREFFSEFQPQVDAHSHDIIGAEALIRWKHPEHGMISPLSFIDLAERAGLIQDLGRFMLDQTVAALRNLQSQGNPLCLSVNVSPRQFTESDLVTDVGSALAGGGFDPSHLELEITESSVMHDVGHAHAVLRAIRDMGVRIALDDFGTGYSSLSHLNRMPLDVIKIDRSFVRHLDDDPQSVTLFRHIAELAHSLQLEIVAEGVESATQARICHAHGCQVLQGYWFHRPMRFERLMQSLGGSGDVRH